MNQPNELSPAARDACSRADALGIPSISVWEIALLATRGRILDKFDILSWLTDAFAVKGNALLPLTIEIASTAASLPGTVGGDPADRLIVATALHLGAPLVTKDDRIRRAKIVDTIW
jgi:PIN domain nuclease of toxin-antitoxin system